MVPVPLSNSDAALSAAVLNLREQAQGGRKTSLLKLESGVYKLSKTLVGMDCALDGAELPDAILEDIFRRLPMSILMSVRQTCSQWNRLVLSDCRMPPTQDRLATFTVVLDRRIVHDGRKLLVAASYNPIHGGWTRQLLPWHPKPAVPGFSSSFVEAAGSLLLYFLTPTTATGRSRFLVFNPIAGASRLLPELVVPKQSSGSGVKLVAVLGDGAASRGKRSCYKVVLVTFVVHGRDRRSITHVYHSDTDCWSSSQSFRMNDKEEWPGTNEWGPKGSCSGDRFAYFTFKTEERPWIRKLMAFDMAEEKWSRIPVPVTTDIQVLASPPAFVRIPNFHVCLGHLIAVIQGDGKVSLVQMTSGNPASLLQAGSWTEVATMPYAFLDRFKSRHPVVFAVTVVNHKVFFMPKRLWTETDTFKLVFYDFLQKVWGWVQPLHTELPAVGELDIEDDDLSYPEEYDRPLCFSPCSDAVP